MSSLSELQYDSYTLFPFRLVEDLIVILRNGGVVFERFSDREISAKECQSIYKYRQEYTYYKTGLRILPLTLAASTLCRIALRDERMAALTRIFSWRQPLTPSVVLHHDADRQPHKTVDIMQLEAKLGAISSNYFFVRRCARWLGDEEPYDVDFNALQTFEKKGFEIGYHQNAMEQSGYDATRSLEIANDDIEILQRHRLNIRTFVPHGGVSGTSGLNNDHTPYAGRLADLVWAYNGRGFLNDVSWSDGYAEAPKADGTYHRGLKDPRVVATSLKGRMRGHFLLHPQYYGHTLRPDWEKLAISQQQWWRNLWNV
jgi:hypothetical protein